MLGLLQVRCAVGIGGALGSASGGAAGLSDHSCSCGSPPCPGHYCYSATFGERALPLGCSVRDSERGRLSSVREVPPHPTHTALTFSRAAGEEGCRGVTSLKSLWGWGGQYPCVFLFSFYLHSDHSHTHPHPPSSCLPHPLYSPAPAHFQLGERW